MRHCIEALCVIVERPERRVPHLRVDSRRTPVLGA